MRFNLAPYRLQAQGMTPHRWGNIHRDGTTPDPDGLKEAQARRGVVHAGDKDTGYNKNDQVSEVDEEALRNEALPLGDKGIDLDKLKGEGQPNID